HRVQGGGRWHRHPHLQGRAEVGGGVLLGMSTPIGIAAMGCQASTSTGAIGYPFVSRRARSMKTCRLCGLLIASWLTAVSGGVPSRMRLTGTSSFLPFRVREIGRASCRERV